MNGLEIIDRSNREQTAGYAVKEAAADAPGVHSRSIFSKNFRKRAQKGQKGF